MYPDVAFLPKENYEVMSYLQVIKIKKYTLQLEKIDFSFYLKNLSDEFDEYCIEIKPKQGWMFDDDSFLIDGDNIKSRNIFNVKKCRYCYLQYLKVIIIIYLLFSLNIVEVLSTLSFKGTSSKTSATIVRLIYFLGKIVYLNKL